LRAGSSELLRRSGEQPPLRPGGRSKGGENAAAVWVQGSAAAVPAGGVAQAHPGGAGARPAAQQT